MDVALVSDDLLYLYTVKFLEDNMADFGWYKLVIFAKGEVIENLREEQLPYDRQR